MWRRGVLGSVLALLCPAWAVAYPAELPKNFENFRKVECRREVPSKNHFRFYSNGIWTVRIFGRGGKDTLIKFSNPKDGVNEAYFIWEERWKPAKVSEWLERRKEIQFTDSEIRFLELCGGRF